MIIPLPHTLGRYLVSLDELNPNAYNHVADIVIRVYKNTIFGITDKAKRNGWLLEGHKTYCISENMQQIFLRHLFRFVSVQPHDLRFVVADSKAYAVLYNMSPDGKYSSQSVLLDPQVTDICKLFNEHLYTIE